MKVKNPNYKPEVEAVFTKSPFIQEVGIVYEDCGPGWCKTHLEIEPRHFQFSGVVHAGVLSTIADHSAGGAAYTLMPVGKSPLTVEFKINLLRPGTGEKLICHAQVLKPGRLFTVVESEVFAQNENVEKLVCKATVTIGVIG